MSDLTMQIFIGDGEPDVQINDTFSVVSLAEFANSPMLAQSSTEELTVWAAQLRMVAQQLDSLAETFPTAGREEA